MGPVSTDVTTATPGSDGASQPSSDVVFITCQRCGTVSPWTPYCPTDGAYLEIFGVPPWQPGGPPRPASDHDHPTDVVIPSAVQADMDGDGSAADLPPIKAEVAGPADPKMAAYIAAQKHAEEQAAAEEAQREAAATAAAKAAASSDGQGVEASHTPAPIVLPSLADREIRRQLPWGLRWTRHCDEGCCDPKPHWWQVRGFVCCWASTKWPLPPLPPIAPPATESSQEASAAIGHLPEPTAELPQRVAEPTHATVALGADYESTGTLECPRCHGLNEEGMAYCNECGATLPGAILAPNAEPVPEPGRDPNKQHGAKKTKDTKKPPRKHDYVAWSVTAGVILLIALVIFAIWGPYRDLLFRGLRLAYQNVVEFVNPYEGVTAQVKSVTASSSLPGVVPGALVDGQTTVFWASAPSADYGTGTVLKVTFASEVSIDRIIISPGIQNGQLSMNALATPASMTLTFDSGSQASFNIDAVEPNGANRQVFTFSDQTTTTVTMTITGVYPPEFSSAMTGTSGEVAISEISFLEAPTGNPIGNGSLVQKPISAVTELVPGAQVPGSAVIGEVSGVVPSSLSSDIPRVNTSTSGSPSASASSTPSTK